MSVITMLGAGMMGSAICVPLVDRGHQVRLVGSHLDQAIVQSVAQSGIHPKLAYELPRTITAYPLERLAEALDGVDAVGLGVSSAGVRWAARALAPHLPKLLERHPELPLFSIAKGLDASADGIRILPDVFCAELPEPLRARVAPVAVAGPCIAGELARRVETAVVLTSRSRTQSEKVKALLETPYYFPFVDDDVVGVEVCAALKNAYAMGIAFATGAHEASGGKPGSIARHNYESAVFAQSLVEMQRIIQLLGGDPRSAIWLPGAGDLDVTTNGGRTGRFGAHLGRGIGLEKAIEAMDGATLECLEILRTMREAVKRFETDGKLAEGALPLLTHMTAVALDDAPVAMPFQRFFGSRV